MGLADARTVDGTHLVPWLNRLSDVLYLMARASEPRAVPAAKTHASTPRAAAAKTQVSEPRAAAVKAQVSESRAAAATAPPTKSRPARKARRRG